MNTIECLAIIGLSINITGSVLLAFSLNKIIKAYSSSIIDLEHFKDTFLSGGNVVSFTGLDKNRKNAKRNNKTLTVIGLVLLMIGFVFQLISILINIGT